MEIIKSFIFPDGKCLSNLPKAELIELSKKIPWQLTEWFWLNSPIEYSQLAYSGDFRTTQMSYYCQRGKILEAMCGGETRISDTKENQIVGLDRNWRALFDYYPWDRKRVYCDLDELTDGKRLPFEDGEFNIISECQGYKYPKDILAVFKEFYRILDNKGVLVCIENNASPVSIRTFGETGDEKRMRSELKIAGFNEISITTIKDGVWLIEARKE